jgi:D-alanyl-D-alanine carboxypeptidase
MKLITTLAALEQLGPAFRARTELRTRPTSIMASSKAI